MKFFFTYHVNNGIIFPYAWSEDEGVMVGKRPEFLAEDDIHEITQEEFILGLDYLEQKYPKPLVSGNSNDTG